MNSSSATPNNKAYIGTGLFVIGIVIVVLVLNVRMKFLPAWLDVLTMAGVTKREEGLYWTHQSPLTLLNIKKNELPSNFPSRFGYSIMFDTIWYESKLSQMITNTAATLPYRHILHRGSDDLTATGRINRGCSASPLSVSGNGLPRLMNPGFFADPVKNDLIIFIDTMRGSTSLRESFRIQNIPLEKAQRLCLIVYENYVEFYKGCRLVLTKTLEGIPRLVDPEIYGLSGGAALNAKLLNLRLWSQPLNVGTIVSECSAPFPDFGAAPSCGSIGGNMADFINAAEQVMNDKKEVEKASSVQMTKKDTC
jgi:hypothetical protein